MRHQPVCGGPSYAPLLPRQKGLVKAAKPRRPARSRLAGAWRVLPAVVTIALLCVPAGSQGANPDTTQPTIADAASAVLVLVCAVALLAERRRPLTWSAVPVLGAPAVAFAVATVTSADPATSLIGFARYMQIFVLVPAALLLLLRSRRDFRWLAGAVVAVAIAQGVVGAHQYVTATGASYGGETVRAVGTFGPGDVMGMATVVSHGIVLALALGVAPPAGSPRWVRPTALTCAALLLVPLGVSFSRGSWISTAVGAMVVLFLAGVRIALGTLAAVAFALLVLVGGAGISSAPIFERLTSITQVTNAPDRSVTDRYALWDAAIGIWRAHPITGVGIKGFPDHRDAHASLGLSSGSDTAAPGVAFRREPLLSPHNMYLLLLSEQGLIGATAVVGSWAALLVLGLRRVWRTHREGGPVDCGLAAVGILVSACVNFLYGDIGGPSTVVTALMFGLATWWALSPDATARHWADVR